MGQLTYRVSKLTERDGFRCHYCGEPLEVNENCIFNPRGVSVDHIVPQSEGGTNALANLVLACRQCNVDKGTGHYHEFRLSKETDGLLRFLMDGAE